MVTRAGARLSGQERAEQLLDVAEQLFITQGFDRTSMGVVAQAAGVTRPVVYEHHGSTAGLSLTAMARARRSHAREYPAAGEGLPGARDVLGSSARVVTRGARRRRK